MKNNELVIIGAGYLSSEGEGVDSFFNQINEGKKTTIIENYDPKGYLGKKGNRYLNKATKMYCNLVFQCLNENSVKEIVEK